VGHFRTERLLAKELDRGDNRGGVNPTKAGTKIYGGYTAGDPHTTHSREEEKGSTNKTSKSRRQSPDTPTEKTKQIRRQSRATIHEGRNVQTTQRRRETTTQAHEGQYIQREGHQEDHKRKSTKREQSEVKRDERTLPKETRQQAQADENESDPRRTRRPTKKPTDANDTINDS